jgi:tellurite resistance protein
LKCHKPALAGAEFQNALELQPAFPEAADNLRQAAWVLATSPDSALRNGAKAVEFAGFLDRVAPAKSPAILATVAAACAEVGRFDEATTNAEAALLLAQAQSNPALAVALQGHLERYRARLPVRESVADDVPTRQ